MKQVPRWSPFGLGCVTTHWHQGCIKMLLCTTDLCGDYIQPQQAPCKTASTLQKYWDDVWLPMWRGNTKMVAYTIPSSYAMHLLTYASPPQVFIWGMLQQQSQRSTGDLKTVWVLHSRHNTSNEKRRQVPRQDWVAGSRVNPRLHRQR